MLLLFAAADVAAAFAAFRSTVPSCTLDTRAALVTSTLASWKVFEEFEISLISVCLIFKMSLSADFFAVYRKALFVLQTFVGCP